MYRMCLSVERKFERELFVVEVYECVVAEFGDGGSLSSATNQPHQRGGFKCGDVEDSPAPVVSVP